MASSVPPTANAALMATATGSESRACSTDDGAMLVGDGHRVLLDRQHPAAGQQVAQQPLPDQHVDQAEQHRPPGHQAQRQEQAREYASEPTAAGRPPGRGRAAPTRRSRRPRTSWTRRPSVAMTGERPPASPAMISPARQRLGQDVHDRAVVDLGTEHAGADDQRDHRQHDGEPEPDHHRLGPTRWGPASEHVGQRSQPDQQQRQRQQQQEPAPAEQASRGDRGDGRCSSACHQVGEDAFQRLVGRACTCAAGLPSRSAILGSARVNVP